MGKASAINAGLKVAEGEIVVLTDVDAKVHIHALRSTLHLSSRGELMAFRKDLVDRVDADAVSDDFHILLKVRKRGYLCVSAEDAFVSEMDVEILGRQLSHKRRTMSA